MNLTHCLVWLPIFVTVGCEVGLTTATSKTNDSGLEQTDEPAGEPSMEPATEPSSESSDPAVDDDGDGYSEQMGDCNDADAGVGPHVLEIPSDDFDQNCDFILNTFPPSCEKF